MEAKLSPYMLSRTCNMNYLFNLNDFYLKLNKINRKESKLEDHLINLDKELFITIGKLPQVHYKKAIKIKQKIKKKNIQYLDQRDLYIFPDKVKKDIISLQREYINVLNEKENLKQEYILQLQHEIAMLKINCKDDFFLNGLLFSLDESTIQEIVKFIKNERLSGKSRRKISKTLKNYMNRATMKPSPFSTFVMNSIYFNNITFTDLLKQDLSLDNKIHVYLNEMIIQDIISLLSGDYELINQLYIKINPTMIESENYYKFYNNKKSYYREAEIKLQKNIKIEVIINFIKDLAANNVKVSKLINIICNSRYSKMFETQKSVFNLILRLVNIGLLETNLNISQMDFHALEKIVKLLNSVSISKYDKLASHLNHIYENLVKINDSKLNIEKTLKYKNSIYNDIKVIALNYNLENLLKIKYKNLLYENYTDPSIISNDNLNNIDLRVEDFDSISKLYKIFDNNLVSQIEYREFFKDKFDIREKVRLVDFFAEITKIKANDKMRLISGCRDLQQILRIRKEFCDFLKENLLSEKDIEIPDDLLNRIWKKAPKIVKLKTNYGVYFQFDEELIINSIAPGYGRHFSRYLTDLSEDDKIKVKKAILDFNDALRIKGKSVYADIGTTLGFNINKHELIYDDVIRYPNSYVNPIKNSIDLSNLYVKYDAKRQSLKVINSDDTEIKIVPLGFQFYRAAPNLYKFLSILSNTQGIKLSLWDVFFELQKEKEDIYHFPRIIYKNIVIERETWKIPLKEVRDRLSNSNFDNYAEMIKFFDKNNIPLNFFAKFFPQLDVFLNYRNKQLKNLEYSLTTTNFRKPQFYDLQSVLDFLNISNIIRKCKFSYFTIQECLPKKKKDKTIREYLIEINDE